VYDARLKKVFLARDRLGVKPLFYALCGGAMVFASEIKALFCHPCIRARLVLQGLWQMVFLLPTRIPGTGVFKDVCELLPGYCMEVSEEGVKSKPYWELKAEPHAESPEETIEHVGYLVKDSITRQLVSDVPLCTLLSGGLDSSIISSVAARSLKGQGRELDTYSFEYEGNREHFKTTVFQPNSDDAYAADMAHHIGSSHTVLSASNEDIAQLLQQAVIYRDLPGMGDVDSSLLYYCGRIKNRHTVSLSGECADEIFGGYPWFAHAPEELVSFPWIYSLEMRSELFNQDVIRADEGIGYINGAFNACMMACPTLEGEHHADRILRRISYASITYFMHSLLERKDRMSMASALEVRVPFADHRIAEYVFNIPWFIKRRDNIEKAVLRDACADVLPPSILHRKKSPYPKTHNPHYEELVRAMLQRLLEDRSSVLRELLQPDIVADIGNLENITWFGQLMARPQLIAYLLQLDFWFRHYKVELAL
jgi:asparagine synthase (glutamine-hydrolysing)